MSLRARHGAAAADDRADVARQRVCGLLQHPPVLDGEGEGGQPAEDAGHREHQAHGPVGRHAGRRRPACRVGPHPARGAHAARRPRGPVAGRPRSGTGAVARLRQIRYLMAGNLRRGERRIVGPEAPRPPADGPARTPGPGTNGPAARAARRWGKTTPVIHADGDRIGGSAWTTAPPAGPAASPVPGRGGRGVRTASSSGSVTVRPSAATSALTPARPDAHSADGGRERGRRPALSRRPQTTPAPRTREEPRAAYPGPTALRPAVRERHPGPAALRPCGP